MQIYMQCDNGEIEVFLCPEDDSAASPIKPAGLSNMVEGAVSSDEATETDTESEASPLKACGGVTTGSGGFQRRPPSPPPRLDLSEEETRTSSDLGQIRNALISASEDFGPMGKRLQLETLDQDQSKCVLRTLIVGLICGYKKEVFEEGVLQI